VTLGVNGWQFNISASRPTASIDFYALSRQLSGQDVTHLFSRPASSLPSCAGLTGTYATYNPCARNSSAGSPTAISSCPLPELNEATLNALGFQNTSLEIGYDWDEVNALYGYMVVNGKVLNLSPYLRLFPTTIANDPVDAIIRGVAGSNSTMGKDATKLFWNTKKTVDSVKCLNERFGAGTIDKTTPGCFFAAIMLYVTLIVIMSIIMIRFAMACFFAWFIGPRMSAPAANGTGGAGISPSVLPAAANRTVHDQNGMAPWAGGHRSQPGTLTKSRSRNGRYEETKGEVDDMVNAAPAPMIPLSAIGSELYTLCLVTCYSEGDDSIRGTLDSISNTDFPDSRKLLFVVCDGMITGSGEKKSTPDICISMLEADPRFGDPEGRGYIAVGIDAKRENQAKVYAGHYSEFMCGRVSLGAMIEWSLLRCSRIYQRTPYADVDRRQDRPSSRSP
jgi:chitin synthase